MAGSRDSRHSIWHSRQQEVIAYFLSGRYNSDKDPKVPTGFLPTVVWLFETDPQASLALHPRVEQTCSMSTGIEALETPQPSAKSGMRFDELYRLKGVVSCLLGSNGSYDASEFR
jgi:hypothetical protein